MVVGEDPTNGCRWRARPVLAAVVTVAVFAIPVVCAIGAAAIVRHLWRTTTTTEVTVVRWAVILGTASIVFIGCQRLTRRALALTVLLKLRMVFPGRAPRRLALARRSWAPHERHWPAVESRCPSINDDPSVAAEQLLVLAAAISARDRKTRGHAERVRAFTDLIAERLRLPEHDRDRLRWSALLHDVGKMTVHSDILNKSGALSDDEWEMMRGHPLEGARLTAPLASWLGDWADTIAEHHERFDGSGYPFGLVGHEISLGARIVAVADFYDARTSLHSYHEPRSTKAARFELAAYAGTQFDPVVVRAFLAVPASRRYAVDPLASIGTIGFGNGGPQLARVADAVGRVGVGAAVAAVGVVALVLGQQAVVPPNLAHLSAAPRTVPHHHPGGTVRTPSTGAGGERPGGAGSSAAEHVGVGSGTSSLVGHVGPPQTQSKDAGSQFPESQPARGGTSGTAPTTTVASGSTPPVPTTTVGGTSPVRTPPGSTTTSTTDPPPPPVIPPSGLTAASDCQAGLVPGVSLSWTASPTTSVTGYAILRGPSVNALTYLGTVSGRTDTSYTDSSVSGLDTTYWYEVEAIAAGSSAMSGPVSVTTPLLCISIS
jgi:putative nucleotidyltransferase with HDIG domain